MKTTDLPEILKDNDEVANLKNIISNSEIKKISYSYASGSYGSLVLAEIINSVNKDFLFITTDKESAVYLMNDIEELTGKSCYFFPASYKRSIQYKQHDSQGIVKRAEVLNKLIHSNKQKLIFTYPEAIVEKVISRKGLSKKTLKIKTGDKPGIEFVQEMLEDYGFSYSDFAYEPGQYAIRGSIIDIFSFSDDNPYRIDFFGDEIESIRSIDIESQLSVSKYDELTVIPNIQTLKKEKRFSLIEYFNPGSSGIFMYDGDISADRIEQIYENTTMEEEDEFNDKNQLLLSSEEMKSSLENYLIIESGKACLFNSLTTIQFNTEPQPVFNKNFELLSSNVLNKAEEGYTTYILSESDKQIERLKAIFKETKAGVDFIPVKGTLHEGFIDNSNGICLYTDHQIFERYHRFKLKDNSAGKLAVNLKELSNLNPGDYVVHSDHGIGKFGGLEKIDVNGKQQEAVKLIYKDNDVIYVSIHALHRISKYKGKDGVPPKVYKLGAGAWQKVKQKTKKRVKDIAKDIISIYAKRRNSKGFSFSPDTFLQKELEASFLYEDTPDQLSATHKVKEAMESEIPMDCLVCGDVGFGKTEVAMRAAFKAVSDNKQVAVLVPTTVLAFQHYNTFVERLENFPCNIEYLSRMKSAGQQKTIFREISEGKIDIVIGTHKLVSKELKFKDLGLLIIDEEQKFGVAVKEKLKKLRENIDTLTLTATPIPRTLQFSLMGARELAVINTPPPNRQPINTELHGFNEDIIREAIEYEISRNGQVFFIHNRVQNIKDVELLIKRTCPGVRIITAHGQMKGEEIERVMISFINGEYDVLVATTIIESGIDIPNANTIIINQAQNFGLSDLHQLRGRVGRSNKKAFCYLLAPPYVSLTQEARRRLKAIEEFSQLGSGFNIAMQDLDIRGAGNLLGAEQSGFIADIGFETYQRILDEAIRELKENEYKDILAGNNETGEGAEDFNFVDDCQVDTDLEVMFPEIYISSIAERINLYRRLDVIKNEEDLDKFKFELEDRFGKLPDKVLDLFSVVRIRWYAIKLGIEKIILKRNKLIISFVSDPESAFYQSPVFNRILLFAQAAEGIKFREDQSKLTLIKNEVKGIEFAINFIYSMYINTKPEAKELV